VGANVGFYTIVGARMVGAGGTVASFEPLHSNRELIAHNVRANGLSNVTCLPYAIGEHDGEQKFMLSEAHSHGMLAGQGHAPMKFVGEVPVEVRNLSGLVSRGALKPPQVIKMDVEGGEAAVLRGANEVIAKYRPILVIELHDTTTAVLRELESQSYHTSLFGSKLPARSAKGNLHIVALPSERTDRDFLLARFQSSSFPRCDRCR
jgi:FkbM family methyltransferase